MGCCARRGPWNRPSMGTGLDLKSVTPPSPHVTATRVLRTVSHNWALDAASSGSAELTCLTCVPCDSLHFDSENSTGRSPILFGDFGGSVNGRMAQFTLKNSTGRPPFCFGAFGGSVNDRAAQFTPQKRTGRSAFLCCVFRGPFSDRGGVFFPN